MHQFQRSGVDRNPAPFMARRRASAAEPGFQAGIPARRCFVHLARISSGTPYPTPAAVSTRFRPRSLARYSAASAAG